MPSITLSIVNVVWEAISVGQETENQPGCSFLFFFFSSLYCINQGTHT